MAGTCSVVFFNMDKLHFAQSQENKTITIAIPALGIKKVNPFSNTPLLPPSKYRHAVSKPVNIPRIAGTKIAIGVPTHDSALNNKILNKNRLDKKSLCQISQIEFVR